MPYKNPEDRKAHSQRYYLLNKQKILAYCEAYRKRNAANYAAYKKDWVEQNRGKAYASSRAWQHRNSEKCAFNQRTWRKLNPDRSSNYSSKRRALKRAATIGDLTAIAKVYELAKWWRQWFQVEVDHVVPLSHGGTHEANNLQIIYTSENRRKWMNANYKPKIKFGFLQPA